MPPTKESHSFIRSCQKTVIVLYPKMNPICRAQSSLDTNEGNRKGIVGDWKNYFTRRDGQLFQQIAGDQLCALGYVQDESWIDLLPEQLALS